MFSDKGKLENSLLIIQTASAIESENDFQPLNDKDIRSSYIQLHHHFT